MKVKLWNQMMVKRQLASRKLSASIIFLPPYSERGGERVGKLEAAKPQPPTIDPIIDQGEECGSTRGNRVSKLLHDFIFDNGSLEADYRGADFMWKRDMLRKRFDRCLFDEGWANLFPIYDISNLIGDDAL
ncbi:hypothetical protein V6N13_039830 [Hibiscus sabdariffa]